MARQLGRARRGIRARWLFGALLVFVLAGVALGGSSAFSSGAGPTIQSDLADYNPGGTVTLTGSNWDPAGQPVHVVVTEDNSSVAWTHTNDVAPLSDGTIKDVFTLATYFVASYSVTATQQTGSGTLTATSSFTDANPSSNLDSCQNGTAASPESCNDTFPSNWANGDLVASKAHYFEGDSVPFRVRLDNLSLGAHSLIINWDTTKGGKHAFDYLTRFDRTVTDANPCTSVTPCSGRNDFTVAPDDPNVTGAGVTPVAPAVFSCYGCTVNTTGPFTLAGPYSGDSTTSIQINFTVTQANPVIAFGAHIATRAQWGANNSAVAISGSPYHVGIDGLDGSGGSQDHQIQSAAVIFPGAIIVIKDATPNGSTSFGFTASPAPLTNFSLVDDGTSANTKLFSNITNFQTYNVNETPIPAGWGFDSVSCSVVSPNGGSYTTTTTAVAINMNEGEIWTCTYLDSLRTGTLIVKKHVVNDNGGTATAGNWSLHVKSGANEVSGSPQAGSESGTSYTLNAGTYTASETGGPSGYTFDGFSGDCDGSGSVTVVAGQTKTCTLTNNDVPPQLHLRKVVVNDNGGTALATAWTLTGDGAGSNDVSGTTPVDSGTGLLADTFALSESGGPSGYSSGTGYSCVGGTQVGQSVTVGIGQSATCTITNNDIPPQLHLRKVVVNDNGGTAMATDLDADRRRRRQQRCVGDDPGRLRYWSAGGHVRSLGERRPVWLLVGDRLSCVGGTQIGQSVTVGIGQSATCTITNNDIPPQLHLRKVVVNDNGGTALATAWTLTGDGAGSNDVSGTTPVDSGTGLLADTFALSESGAVWLLVGDRLLLCGWHPGRAVGHGRDRPVGDLHDHQQRRGWASQAGQGGRE